MRRYVLSVVVVALAIAVRTAFDPVFGPRYAFLTFVLAITGAAWFGGLGPGVLATVISALTAAGLWLPPAGLAVVGRDDQIALVIFIAIGVTVSLAMESLHRARQRAERTEDDLRRISDAVPTLIAYIDADRRFRFVNAPYAARHRRSRASVVGATVSEVLGVERYARMRPHLDAALDGHKVSFQVLTPYEQEPTDQIVTCLPDILPDGTVRGAIVVITDLSDIKSAERERAELLKRTEEARAAAEAANRSKDEFLAVLSHELRTPLTSMLGWARLLRTPNLPAHRLAHGLEVIERNTRLQARLISDLLDVSRIVAGKLQLDRHEVELVATVETALEALQADIEAKNITVTRQLDTAASRVLGDGTRLQQIAVNLVSNAVKFTPPGGRIDIRLTAAGDRARLCVSDTGIGIAPEVLPNVFDRFLQATTPSNRGAGLGLGLAIVRHLVELHGGRVWAESAGLERGATFTVELPLLTEPRIVVDGVKALERAPQLDGVHVLLVEDDVDAREMLRMILVDAGASVSTAHTAEAALDASAADRPDVLVSDIGLPGRDGYALLHELREIEGREGSRTLPAIALTAYAAVEDRQRAFAAGFQFHLPKPVDPSHLVALVARAGRKK
jgi:signal transduction histidine kinase/ActR/RegA family two-component response regulator